jgi:hypothetical protein
MAINNSRHLIWILYGALTGFGVSFVFGDLFTLPVDLYYLIYFGIVIGFFLLYIKKTKLDLKAWLSKRLVWGILLGIAFGILMVSNVLSRPATEQFTGAYLASAVLWRGVLYGAIDGLLLSTFPWIVTWRAFEVEGKPFARKVVFGFVAWLFIVVMTTAYHVGYADFRSAKVIQANIGNTIMSAATLFSANPVATPITHAMMHTAAVIHSPKTELFLPPHR